MSAPAKEVVTVQPPAHSELQYLTHCFCCAQAFWFKMPQCIGVAQTGTCCCCTGASECRLIPFSEADNCFDTYATSMCISLKGCKEEGCTKTVWCQSSGRGICCFICMQKQQFTCRFPTTCCKCATQELCCDYRCAIPCDEDVPSGCAICGKVLSAPAQQPTGWNGVPDQGAPVPEAMNSA